MCMQVESSIMYITESCRAEMLAVAVNLSSLTLPPVTFTGNIKVTLSRSWQIRSFNSFVHIMKIKQNINVHICIRFLNLIDIQKRIKIIDVRLSRRYLAQRGYASGRARSESLGGPHSDDDGASDDDVDDSLATPPHHPTEYVTVFNSIEIICCCFPSIDFDRYNDRYTLLERFYYF